MIRQTVRRHNRSGLSLVAIALPAGTFVLLSAFAPNFFSAENIGNINNQIAALLIVALGQLVVALIGGLDISVGSVVSLTSVLIVSLEPSMAVPIAFLTALAIGLANGLAVTFFRVHPIIMTLATMIFVQGFALLILSAAGGVVPPWIISLAASNVGGLPAAFFWSVLAIGIVSFLLYKTAFGLRLFAIGANVQSAMLSGVGATAPRIMCYVLCSLSGAVAGVYLCGRIASGDPTMGQAFGLDSVTAIALGGVQLSGGVGSVAGALLGTITLGLISNGMNLSGISPFFSSAVTGVLLLAAVSFQRRRTIGV